MRRLIALTGFGLLLTVLTFPPGPGNTTSVELSSVLADAAPEARIAEGGATEAGLHDPHGRRPESEELPMALRVVDTRLVAQVTGGTDAGNNTTSRWDIHGTDLGHMFWHRGHLYMVFGDTFGQGGLGGSNWRSNTLARLVDPVPAQGLHIDEMITGPDGAARELIPSRKIEGTEKTVIPTNGISVDNRMYLHYMSVVRWGDGGGVWDVRHSGFAYSDDDGQHWRVPKSAIWAGGSGFEQVAFARDGTHVYNFGIPGGRWGGVRLRRVAPHAILDRGAYEYWDGTGWCADPRHAAVVVPAPAGELSVAWSERHRLWLMMYLNPGGRAAVLRTAPELVGPWSGEQVAVTADQYPGLYAPYIVPTAGVGDDVYFTMSMWQRYNVFLMHMKLTGTLAAGNDAT